MQLALFSDDAPPFAIGAQSPPSSSSPQFPVPRVVNVKDEWTPVSHGDPLRDDATLYYAPPSLERVRITSRHEHLLDNLYTEWQIILLKVFMKSLRK